MYAVCQSKFGYQYPATYGRQPAANRICPCRFVYLAEPLSLLPAKLTVRISYPTARCKLFLVLQVSLQLALDTLQGIVYGLYVAIQISSNLLIGLTLQI